MAKRIGGRPRAGSRGRTPDLPGSGDLIWLSFSPQAGREQASRRPGLVLSPRAYNERVGLCLVCPVTQQIKDYAFEVALPTELPVQGVVLADHVKSVDWRERNSAYIATVPAEVHHEVCAKLRPLLGMS